jgi:hypothetical protein
MKVLRLLNFRQNIMRIKMTKEETLRHKEAILVF